MNWVQITKYDFVDSDKISLIKIDYSTDSFRVYLDCSHGWYDVEYPYREYFDKICQEAHIKKQQAAVENRESQESHKL